MRNTIFAAVNVLLLALGGCTLAEDLADAKAVAAALRQGTWVAEPALKKARNTACSALADYGQQAIILGVTIPGNGPRTTAARASIATAIGAGSDLCDLTSTQITAVSVVQAIALVSKIETLFGELKAAAGR